MSKERDHHYVPQFHLRMWEGSNGKLVQWGRIAFNSKLVRTPVTTAATAYVPGLYSLKHVLPDEVQQIETKIFGRIENEAKPVLKKLIVEGPRSLTVKERYWWTMYLNASLLRVPHIVEQIKSGVDRRVNEELSKDLDDYNSLKGDAPEQTLLEWATNHAPGRLANSGLNVLVRLLNNERVIDRIIHLTWLVKDVSSASRSLLLGDDPFERINDLYKPRTLISIPLSPSHVFFGTDAADVMQRIQRMRPREVVRASNISTLSTAKRFAYGEAESSFVDRYLLRSAQGINQPA